MNPTDRHRLPTRLGTVGATLGVVAGLVQTFAGPAIPEWTGNKLANVPLGLLTVALSVLAALAARRQGRPGLSVLGRAACALGLLGPGLLCLSTVGRLWYAPAVLLVAGGVLTVDSWRSTAHALAQSWARVLLGVLGGSEVLMAAGASAPLSVVGAVGGLLLMTAAWVRVRPWVVATLVAIGTIPFAALGWTALVPLLLLVLAAGLVVPLVRGTTPDARRVR